MAEAPLLTRSVRAFMAPPPPVIAAGMRIDDAVAQLTERDVSCLVVIGQDTEKAAPLGIVTERDIVHRAAFRAAPETSVADIMTSPVRCVSESDPLYAAIGDMRRYGLRHMPVVDGSGALTGMLNLHDALAAASRNVTALIDKLTHDATGEGLAAIKSAQVEIAATLLEDGVSAVDIQSLITHINRDIHRRVLDRAVAEMQSEGYGPPPVAFTAIVMGSGGRNENYLYPDQDNGFILADYPDDEHTAIDGYFIALAARMNEVLDEVGFPLCDGGVMAINPVWRKTLPQWHAQTKMWAAKRSVTAVRLADIFFDFQPVYGDMGMAADLRRHVSTLMKGNIAFLGEINRDQAAYGTALGLFGRLRTVREDGPTRGMVDIKKGALLPMVNAVRILALRDGVAATSTLARIAALGEIGTLGADEADELRAAFSIFTSLLLRRQVEQFLARQPVTNAVPLRYPSRRERGLLKDGLRAIERLSDRVSGELTGDVLTGGAGARPG